MPTGYTAGVQDGKITTFEEFAMQCARGMGALIMMRDLPSSAPIPDRFEPSVQYHDERIAAAEARLAEVQAMSLPALREAAQQDYAKAITSDQAWMASRAETRKRYEAMLARVNAWTPPTSEHEGFQAFMRQQLEESIDFDCPTKRYTPEPVKLEPEAWAQKQTEEAARDLAYHTKARGEEVKRTEARNLWLSDLRRSLTT